MRDGAKTGFARRILHFAGAVARLYFRRDPLCDGRAACLGDLVLDVLSCEPEAVANRDWVGLVLVKRDPLQIRMAERVHELAQQEFFL